MSLQDNIISNVESDVKGLKDNGATEDEIVSTLSSQKSYEGLPFQLSSLVHVIFIEPGDASTKDIMDDYIAFTASPPTPTSTPTTAPTFPPSVPCASINNQTQLEFPPLIFADDIGSDIASGIRIVGGTDAGAGSSIAVGDINNDGREDIIIGAPKAKKIYVVMGNALTGPSLNLAAIETGEIPGLVIQSQSIATFAVAQNIFGISIASGDMNLDGYDDIAFITIDGVCIVFGGAHLPKIINLNDIVFSNLGVCTSGITTSYITITDFNGDGPSDLIVLDSDQINIFLGNSSLSSTTNLVDCLFSIRLTNDTSYSYGWASAVGDLNGDHKQDLLVTLNSFSPYAYVVFGIGNIIAPSALDLFDIGFADDTAGVLLNGSAINLFDPSNPSKNSGDFNHDGHNDIAIVDMHEKNILMIYGPFNANNNNIDISAIGTDGNDQGVLFPVNDLTHSDRSRIGGALLTNLAIIFQDLNNDNISDFTIAYPGHPDSSIQTSKACIVFGHDNPEAEISLLNSTAQITLIEGSYAGFGSSLATCDANCDGIPDLLVGAPFRYNTFVRRDEEAPTPSPTILDDNVFIFFG